MKCEGNIHKLTLQSRMEGKGNILFAKKKGYLGKVFFFFFFFSTQKHQTSQAQLFFFFFFLPQENRQNSHKRKETS